ncbi:primosomal protein N' [Leuconostocaceae bacterium ESL0958]|nr:primosomal protein N' [Leuconostocaceae bacterium ESL0958]
MANTYAAMIVDVPTTPTNRPYTYRVPDEMVNTVQAGCRVLVPFGHREVLAYVLATDVAKEGELSDDQVKPVLAVLDEAPVLSQELLDLSSYLAENNFSYQLSFLAQMLPNALKASYKKRLVAQATLSDEDRVHYLAGQPTALVKTSSLTARDWRYLRRLAQDGQLVIEDEVTDQGRIKEELAYRAHSDVAFLTAARNELTKNAQSQRLLLDFLIDHPGQIFSKRDWLAQVDVSPATLTTAVKKGFLEKTSVELRRQPVTLAGGQKEEKKVLNADQQAAYTAIATAIDQQKNETFLLEGITGSGKTEVYLQAAEKAIAAGKQVLFLVPEIALTPQMQKRVADRFGAATALLHSGLSNGERYDEWRRIRAGQVKVVVGARSAVFAPLTNLGLLIVDEEHERSYTQSENPSYSAKEVALWRAAYQQAPLVLGSATPSLESRARAQKGRYQFLQLRERAVAAAQLPPVEIVDMKETVMEQGDTNFSPVLLEKLQAHLDRGEQAILMLNRRGFSSFVMCRNCGFVPKDPNCNLAMTLHMDTRVLKCHYCDYQEPIPQSCPVCGSKRIRYYGTGTEKVAAELQQLLPAVTVIRVDQDSTRKKGALQQALTDFGAGKAQVLLGTQMVAKGLDFEKVTLVGVLNADTALGLPDFRASEHTFDLLTQVAGRAGRGAAAGEVVIQTFNPSHYALTYAQQHDYEGFYRQEMYRRHLGQFPPYYYTIQIQTSAVDENDVAVQTAKIGRWLKQRLPEEVIVLGPSPKSIAKLRGRYYFQILLKLKDPHQADDWLRELVNRSANAARDFRLQVTRDPVSFM